MVLRTHFQPGATIVQVHGEIGSCNVAQLSDHVDDLARAISPMILDLRSVASFNHAGFRTLARIAEKSHRRRARWTLVPGDAVGRFLSVEESGYRLPIAASVEQALRQSASPDPAWSLPHRITPRGRTRC